MSVLGTISLSGLGTTTQDFGYFGDLYVENNLTLGPSATLILPPASVSDTALSSNVALKNASNTFTQPNIFTNGIISKPSTFQTNNPSSNANITCVDNSNATESTMTINNLNYIFNSFGQPGSINTSFSFLVKNSTANSVNCLLLSDSNPQFVSSGVLTQSATMPASTDSSTKVPTTAWVQSAFTANLSLYGKLSLANTWTQQNTFSQGLISNGTIYSQNSAGATMWQFTDVNNATIGTFKLNNNVFTCYSGGNNGSQIFQMKDSGGAIQNVLTLNYANTVLNAPLSTSNTNTFSQSGVNIPLTFTNPTGAANYQGRHFVASSVSAYNPIVNPNEYVVFADNSSGVGLGTLTLTTHSNNSVGIKISNTQNSVYGPQSNNDVIKTSTTVTPFAGCLGDIWTSTYFTPPLTYNWNLSWNGTSNYNLYTLNFNNTGNQIFGTYLIDTHIQFTTTTANLFSAVNWNNISNAQTTSTNMNIVPYNSSFYQSGPNYFLYDNSFCFTVQIYANTTFYMNAITAGGTALAILGSSYFSFTRIG